MIYQNWLILGFGSGQWRAKEQSFPFAEVTGLSSLEETKQAINQVIASR